MVSGIYMIKNLFNGKVYIGKSYNIEKRFYEHKRRLINNTHDNVYLQRSWNKYGEDQFSFTIIEECEESILNEKEIYYIDILNSNNLNYGYNLTNGGDGATGYKHTLETRKKLSEMQSGRKLSDEHKEKIRSAHIGKKPKNINILLERNIEYSKPIVQINIIDQSVVFWASIQECARDTEIFATNIVKCLKGAYKTCGNSIFLYKDDYESNNIDIELLIKERTNKRKITKGIVKLSLNMDFLAEFSSMKELENEGYARRYLRLCCISKKESYKGFKWMYKDDYYNNYLPAFLN